MKTQTTQTQEIIVPIKGYEGSYSISNLGYVISYYKKGTSRIIGKTTRTYGYPTVRLYEITTGNSEMFYIHRLIIQHFKPGLQDQVCVNHIDGNKRNNHVDNLEACTQKENIHAALRNSQRVKMTIHAQRNKPRAVIVYDPVDDITYTAHSMYSLAKSLGVKICAIYNACNGLQKTCKGLILRYAD